MGNTLDLSEKEKILEPLQQSEKILKEEIKNNNYKLVFAHIKSIINYVNNTDDTEKYNEIKQYYKNHFSYALVTEEAITKIKHFLFRNKCKVLLEIGSGFGLWSALINLSINYNKKKDEKIVNVIATDKIKYPDEYLYYNVKKRDYIYAIEEYSDINSCLFLCWPPYNSPVASESLKQFKGNYLIFIGEFTDITNEYMNANVATREFFEILDKEWEGVSPKNWQPNTENYFGIPNWYDIEDSIYFYQRKVKISDGVKSSSKRRRQSSKRKSKRKSKRN
jgi:hypothetical protein